MIPLASRSTTTGWTHPDTDVWRIAAADAPELSEHAVVVQDPGRTPSGAAFYITTDPQIAGPGPTVHVTDQLSHLGPGDVVVVADDGSRLNVAWKATATHNSIMLTERCDHYCLMCSQPPKERDDSHLYDRAMRVISALPSTARALSLTGGEPTLESELFFELLEHISDTRPDLAVHILSNGRRFADPAFTERYARLPLDDYMVGIPLYAAEPALHDYVVQAHGAFNETVAGILNLAASGSAIELRVVIQKSNVDHLDELATFIARNLPFVNQVALMGLEMTGLARPNRDLVWVDPYDYRDELRTAYQRLSSSGMRVHIYNHPLCIIDRELWPAAVQSISDWKNDFPDLCEPCVVKDDCAGVFTTSGTRLSPHLEPVTT
jgi:His-Xaa-Ser system radical SAM maturase HxsC